MWYSRSSGLDWRPKNLRNFLRDFHFSFMSYCWRSWATYLPRCLCVCDIIHREGPALVTSGHTQVKCQKSENCVYCACVSVAASVYFPFLAIQFQVASLFIYYCTRTRVGCLRRRCCVSAAAATAAVGITKSLNQLLTTGRVSLPKQQHQQKVSQVADWASNEVICRRLRQTAACVIPLSNPGLVARTELLANLNELTFCIIERVFEDIHYTNEMETDCKGMQIVLGMGKH